MSYKLSLLFLFLSHFSSIVSQLGDEFSFGSCNLVKDQIYYFGGKQQSIKENSTEDNNTIIKLMLKNHMNINQPKSIRIEQKKQELKLGSKIKSQSIEDKIYLFGGENVKFEECFKVYDIKKDKLETIQPFDKRELFSDIQLKKDTCITSFIMEANKENIILIGGKYKDNKNKEYLINKIINYNIKSKKWSLFKTNFTTTEATSVLYQDQIYLLGNKGLDNKLMFGLDKLVSYNLKNNKINIEQIEVNIKETDFTPVNSILIKDQCILFDNNKYSSSIVIYDFKKKNYIIKQILGYNYNNSCLIQYKQYIINLFGNLNRNNPLNLQFINTNQYQFSNQLILEENSISIKDNNTLIKRNFTTEDIKITRYDIADSSLEPGLIMTISFVSIFASLLVAFIITVLLSNPVDKSNFSYNQSLNFSKHNLSNNNINIIKNEENSQDMNDYLNWLNQPNNNNNTLNIPLDTLNKK
ncbi:hypothetical protein K502DRAFT_362639 [Neoconidiobolus thromboides FSU 785]|nr:hypothetical protein K502DRAFT_362639 [Neoconidiobolus thromboides FSU 785]